jgi:hypothetical protein
VDLACSAFAAEPAGAAAANGAGYKTSDCYLVPGPARHRAIRRRSAAHCWPPNWVAQTKGQHRHVLDEPITDRTRQRDRFAGAA